MVGLVQKDIRLLRTMGRMVLIMLALCAVMVFASNDFAFLMGYIPLVTVNIATLTISYDELNNGMAFLMTLPITRRQYVREKYLMTLGIGILGECFAVLCGKLQLLRRGEVLEGTVFAMYVGIAFLVMILLESFMIPVLLKYGVEKAKIILIFGMIGIAFGFAMLIELVEKTGVDVSGFLRMAERIGKMGVCAVLAAAAILILIGSYEISVRILEKKEY